MSGTIGFVVEILVAVLLLMTIGYCAMLNKRLCRFKADEGLMKATVAELVDATTAAQRAIDGLKGTLQDCEGHLDHRIVEATELIDRLKSHIQLGEGVVARVARIVAAGRADHHSEPLRQDAGEAAQIASMTSVAAAAKALVERQKTAERSA